MPKLIAGYNASNYDQDRTLGDPDGAGWYDATGQSFTTPNDGVSYVLNSCKFYLKKVGSPTGNATAYLRTHSGTYGTSSLPTGAVLATSDVLDVSTLTTSYALVEINFSGANQYTMAPNTQYIIEIFYEGGTYPGTLISVGRDGSSPAHSGNAYDHENAGYTARAADTCFSVFSTTEVPTTHSIDLETGSSQYLTATDSVSLSPTGDATFEKWVNAESLVNDEMTLFYKDDSAGTGYVYRLVIMPYDTTNDWTILCQIKGTGGTSTGAGTIYDLGFDVGTPHHIAATFNASTKHVSLYYDGRLISNNKSNAENATTITDSTGILYIGADTQVPPSRRWDGLLNEGRIWGVVRTAAQINENMYKKLSGDEFGLLAYWKLNNDLTDSTLNENTLTGVNSPTFSTTVPFGYSPTRIGTDTVTAVGSLTGLTQMTVPHTVPVGGLNKRLVVEAGWNDNSKNITGITWNGVALTQDFHRDVTQRQDLDVYSLANPDTGTHDIVVTFAGTGGTAGRVVAFTLQDCAQSSPTDGTNSAGVSSTAANASVTGSVNGDYYLVFAVQNGGSAYVDDGAQARIGTLTGWSGSDNYVISELIKQSAGAQSMGYTWTTSGGTDLGVVTYKYAPPTSLKLIKGLAYGSVKTKKGLAIASVKTIKGLS